MQNQNDAAAQNAWQGWVAFTHAVMLGSAGVAATLVLMALFLL